MLWSIRIATIAGTAVRIHVTFLLFLVWIGLAQWRAGGSSAAIDGVVFMILIFACVLAHEFGHIFAARRYGIRTPEVTLWPIGGVASLERIPEKPAEELIVAIAGPLVNVVIAAVLILYLSVSGAPIAEVDNAAAPLVARLAAANIILVLFNLIPAFPMDGGRVLRALLAMRMGPLEATRIAARIGQGAAFLFALLGLMFNPILILIAMFVYLAATAEAQHVGFRDSTKGLSVRQAMVSAIETLTPASTLADAVNLLIRTSQTEFPVVDGGGRARGLLTRDSLIRALAERGQDAPALDFMTPAPSAPAGEPLESSLARLQQAKTGALFVVDAQDRLVGLLTRENIAEMMLVQSVRPDFRFGRPRAA